MNSRRKFLLQGSMATTALIVAKPFKTFAEASAGITGFASNDNQVKFLHTGNLDEVGHGQVARQVAEIKNKAQHVVLLDAGHSKKGPGLPFDASISQQNAVPETANNYRIIYKGNIKIGVISAAPADAAVIHNINTLSTFLKMEQKCHIVVCLSQLGYKNKHKVDDITLAANSASLDMIIGGDLENYSKHPIIALNKNNDEVIINHAAGYSLALGEIDMAFDNAGKKRNIVFNDSRLQLTA
jgi:2',3'-cyclic-nucleotide 2'-phosphodiesterase (5'-nucleotidase family)